MRKNYLKQDLDLSHCRVFLDFDNTITHFDVLDDIIKRFAVNKGWKEWEVAWERGQIGSRQCLKEQMDLVAIGRKELLKYLSRVKVDPYFKKLIVKFRKHGIRSFILSDSFSFIIENVLRNNAIRGIKVYSNRLRFSNGRIKFSFPHKNDVCLVCAHCKKKNLLKSSNGSKIIIYIGDGMSDVCAARHADLVFAKGKLLKYFMMEKRKCVPMRNLKDVYDYFNNGKIIWHEKQN